MNRWTGVALGSAGVLCFSGTAPATRVAVEFGPATVTAGRILIAAVLGAVTLLATRQLRWPGRRMALRLVVAGSGLAVGYPLFLALAVEQIPAHHAGVVIGLTPAATAVLSALRLGERPPTRFWWSCAAGFGVIVAFAVLQAGSGVQVADIWLLAGVLSTAVEYVEGGRIAAELGGTATLCWAMILLSPAAIVVIALSPPTPATSAAWVGPGYAGVFSMFLGSILWYHGLAAGGVGRIGQLNLAQPFLAIVWSALLLDEQLTWAVPATATAVLACVAVCLSSRPNFQKNR